MTQEILKRAFEALDNLLYWDNGKPEYDEAKEVITAIKENLREHAMREVQRLGQEIEQEPVCPDCKAKVLYECVACSSNNYPPKTKQEPVAYLTRRKIGGTESLLRADMVDKSAKNQETHDFIPLYTTPPQRTWVGLTDEEYIHITDSVYHQGHGLVAYYKAIEAKLKEKNT